MKQHKLLIIGASIGQLPLLRKAKQRGIHVTVASIPGNYVCFPMADDIIYADIFDRDLITYEAKKRGITAVISDQNDLMMPTVAYVSEKLGLPGNTLNTVMSYCNKNRFRDVCNLAKVPCPKHKEINTRVLDFNTFDLSFPLMVKPADSQSSIGVQKVNNKEQLLEASEIAIKKSQTKSAIVEEFFVGREIVCEGFVNEGKYYNLEFADRRYFDLHETLIPCQTIFPSNLKKEIRNKIIEYEQALTNITKPNFGITHSEYLINEDTGKICIVESALRGGGVYISSDLIPLATGIDINDVLLDKALGLNININDVFRKRENKAAAYVCFYLPEGHINSIFGVDNIKAMPFVKSAFLDNLIIGEKTMPPTYKGARQGPIIVQGDNRDDLEQNIQIIENTLNIRVKSSDGSSKGICWS